MSFNVTRSDAKYFPKKARCHFCFLLSFQSVKESSSCQPNSDSQNIGKLFQLSNNGIFKVPTNKTCKYYSVLNLVTFWQIKFKEKFIWFVCACEGKRAFLSCIIDCFQTDVLLLWAPTYSCYSESFSIQSPTLVYLA